MGRLLFCFYFMSLVSCISVLPYEEYAIAQRALLRAQKFSVEKTASQSYSKALILYKKGVDFYKNEKYEKAFYAFKESILFSEKAELKARIKQKKEQEN